MLLCKSSASCTVQRITNFKMEEGEVRKSPLFANGGDNDDFKTRVSIRHKFVSFS